MMRTVREAMQASPEEGAVKPQVLVAGALVAALAIGLAVRGGGGSGEAGEPLQCDDKISLELNSDNPVEAFQLEQPLVNGKPGLATVRVETIERGVRVEAGAFTDAGQTRARPNTNDDNPDRDHPAGEDLLTMQLDQHADVTAPEDQDNLHGRHQMVIPGGERPTRLDIGVEGEIGVDLTDVSVTARLAFLCIGDRPDRG